MRWAVLIVAGLAINTAMVWTVQAEQPTAFEIAQSEADGLAKQVAPISAPLHITYRPTPTIRLSIEMDVDVNGVPRMGLAVMNFHAGDAGSGLWVMGTFESFSVGGRIFGCGRQPLLYSEMRVEPLGQVSKLGFHPTVGCPEAAEFVSGDALSSINAMYFVYPPQGVTTGTTLEQAPVSGHADELGDARGIVAGLTDWHGRPALAVRLVGCSHPKFDGTPVMLCVHGINFMDMASGFPIGGLTYAQYGPMTFVVRTHPE